MNEESRERQIITLPERRFIGHLIQGTEGRPIRHADLPDVIETGTHLLPRIQMVWDATVAADYDAEYYMNATTHGDRKLHVPREVKRGDEESISAEIWLDAGIGIPFGIHSHNLFDTPDVFLPSFTDLVNLCGGRGATQAEIVASLNFYIMMLRTDQTPIFSHREATLSTLNRFRDLLMFSHQMEASFDYRQAKKEGMTAEEALEAAIQYYTEVYLQLYIMFSRVCNDLNIGLYLDFYDGKAMRIFRFDIIRDAIYSIMKKRISLKDPTD